MESYMLWVWLAVFVITIVTEACTQDLVSIWFAIGSLIAMAVCGFAPFWAEIIVFSVVSVLALICTRPLVKKMMAHQERFTNTDEFIGKKVICEKKITKFDSGEIKINGVVYTAVLMEDSNEEIEKNTVVEVVALKGNKVIVKKINDNNDNIEIING